MEGVEIPSLFLCPISLQIMRDPVILSTGITYDRDSIEKWIFAGKHSSCPVTKQPLEDVELTPNHTLRRLIQSWCALHSSAGIERIPTPRAPVYKAEIAELLEEAKLPQSQLGSLRKLKAIVSESERSRRCVESIPGIEDFLASIIASNKSNPNCDQDKSDGFESKSTACDEALHILHSLQISEEGLLDLFVKNPDIIDSLTAILRGANHQSRALAMIILRSLLGVLSPDQLNNLSYDLSREIVAVLRDRISAKATKAALHALVGLCPLGRIRITVVEAGGVHVLVELLLDDLERRVCELALAVLNLLCGFAEGRAEFVSHAGGILAVSKKILWVSQLASEKAVRIFHSMATYSPTTALLQEMAQVGAVSKLCLVVQTTECTAKTKEKAKEILRMHARVWRKSPCLSSDFKSLYPTP